MRKITVGLVVVLVMHGGIPKDFPRAELKRFRQLRLKGASGDSSAREMAQTIENKMRLWPRTEENDAYYRGSEQLRRALQEELAVPVLLAFNEFCAPSVEEAIREATGLDGVRSIRVVTPMLTRGGRHSEFDIPEAIQRAESLIDDDSIDIQYIWPIHASKTAEFLAAQIHAHRS